MCNFYLSLAALSIAVPEIHFACYLNVEQARKHKKKMFLLLLVRPISTLASQTRLVKWELAKYAKDKVVATVGKTHLQRC